MWQKMKQSVSVTNVFGLNLCQLRKEASGYHDSIGFSPFSFRSTYVSQDNQPAKARLEFTQFLDLMKFCARSAKIWLVKFW